MNSQIVSSDANLDLARFLYSHHVKLDTKDFALKFVSKLLTSNFLFEFTRDFLNPKYRAEFDRLVYIARNPTAARSSNPSKSNTLTNRKRLNPMSEKRYIELTDQICAILKSNKTPIPADLDSFMLNLVTSEKFRTGICKKFPPKDFKRIKELCQDLLDNEMKDDACA